MYVDIRLCLMYSICVQLSICKIPSKNSLFDRMSHAHAAMPTLCSFDELSVLHYKELPSVQMAQSQVECSFSREHNNYNIGICASGGSTVRSIAFFLAVTMNQTIRPALESVLPRLSHHLKCLAQNTM